MRLKELRTKRDLKQREVIEAIRNTDKRIDGFLYSKYENGIALPTPLQLQAICEILGATVEDIYDKSEIEFKAVRACRKRENDCAVYKLTMPIENEYRKYFDKKALQLCGYHDLHDWVVKCADKLKKAYERKVSKTIKRKNAHGIGAQGRSS